MNGAILKRTRAGKAGDERRTPPWLYRLLDEEFQFTLDPCAANCVEIPPLAPTNFSAALGHDGLAQAWGSGARAFVNPPYSPGSLPRWIEKAIAERRGGCTSVLLLPASTCTEWWRALLLEGAEIRFVYGRVRFGLPPGLGAYTSAPFPSVVAVLRPSGGPPRLGPIIVARGKHLENLP